VQASPRAAGIEAGDWNWKVVRIFCRERFGVTLSRSSCLNYLHRLGFVVRRPKKRLLKADEAKREAFVREYRALRVLAQLTGAKIFFIDEAHFYADADLRGKWVLKGEPALVDSTSPRYGEKASYYSAVCLETGEVVYLALEGNSTAETSVAFLKHLRAHHPEPLIVIWDNAPAHGGDPIRAYLRTPDLHLRLVRLPPTAPTSTPTSTSGAGSGRKSRPIPASAPPPRSGRTSSPSSPASLPAPTRSSSAAAPSCRPRPTRSTPSPPPPPSSTRRAMRIMPMQIPPWLWFRS
jgi:hypothetical protein